MHGVVTVFLAPHRIAVLNAPVALSSLVAGAAFVLKARGASNEALSSTVLAGVIINVGGGLTTVAAMVTSRWAARQRKKLMKANTEALLPRAEPKPHDESRQDPLLLHPTPQADVPESPHDRTRHNPLTARHQTQ